MKLIATLFLMIQVVFPENITTCQQENYLSVIGGSSYTVNLVYTAINSIYSTIAVGGLLTQTALSTPIAYFYLFSTKSCQLITQNQFPAYTSGIQAISFSPDNNQVAMVAYSASAEFLIIVEMTSLTYETYIYQTGSQSDIVRTLSLLGVGYDRYFVVGAQKIRKVFAGGNAAEVSTGAVFKSLDFNAPLIKCATKTSSAIYALLQKNGTPSIILTKLDYQLNELNSYSTNNGVSTTWAENEARISNAVGPPTSTAVAVCVYGLTGKVQFTMYISDDTSHAVSPSTTYKTSSWAQCLGVRAIDGSNADYVLIDGALTLWWYSINFGTGTLQARQTLTPALTGWQGGSDQRSNAVLGQGFTLLPGLVTQILGITNGYVLGFVRINEDDKWSTNVLPQISLEVLIADPTPVLGQVATLTETYTSQTVQLTSVLAPTIQKSDWTKDFCPDIQDSQQGTSSCIYWAMYDNPQAVALLDTSRKGVPKEAGLCPQTTNDYLDISLALKPIRQVCFPYLKKLPKSIPQLGSTGNYLVEQNGAVWNWPRSIPKGIATKSAPLVYETDTDDKVKFPGDHFSLKFAGQLATNKVVKISRGNNFKQIVATPSKIMKMKNQPYTVAITCLSLLCPQQLLIQNDTMIADSSDICDSELNKSYIYKVEIYYTAVDVLQFSTVTFNFTCSKLKSPININLPWAQWVELNGKTSKYRPTPLTKDQKKEAAQSASIISSDDVAQLLSDVIPEAQRVISKWTNDQVATAVAEARERKDKIPKTILFTAKVGNQGNLRLIFSNPVALPGYLLFDSGATESNALANPDQTNLEGLTAKSRRMKCVGGVCPDLPSFEEPAEGSGEEGAADGEEPAEGEGEAEVPAEGGGEAEVPVEGEGEAEIPAEGEEEDEVPVEGEGEDQRGREQGDEEAPKELGGEAEGGTEGGVQVESGGQISEGQGGEKAAEGEGGDKGEGKDEASKQEEEATDDKKPSGCSDEQLSESGDDTCQQEDTVPLEEEPILGTLDCTLPENLGAVDCGGSDPAICSFGSYFDKINAVCKKYVIYFGEWKDLVNIVIVPDPNRDPAQSLKDLAHTFHVAGATVDHMDIQIDFENPLKVTVRDKVQFELKFNQIEPALPGVSGSRRLAAELGKTMFSAQMTPQLPKGGAKSLQTAAASLQAATIGTVVGSAILQILLSGALAQIWGMINGIQIIIYLPLLAIQFPANALMIIDKILIVACFDIPYLNMEEIYGDDLWVAGDDVSIFTDLNENDLVTSGMDSLGFSSRMLSANLGSVFIFMTLSFGLLGFIGILELLQRSGKFQTFSKPGNRGFRLLNYLKKKFLWNYFIRLFFECCLELIIATWVGVKYGHFWNPEFPVPVTAATVICFALSLWWFIVVAGLPIFFLSFYWHYWEKVKDEDFESKFGCVYEGLKTKSKLALVYPIFFVMRRCCLLVTVIAGYRFIWLQIMVQLAFCFFIILFVYMTWPFEDNTQNKLEIMNEVTTVVLLYIIYMFSDLILDQEIQYMVGYFFIGILISNLSVHLTLICISIFKDLVEKIKGWVQACKKKREKSKRIVVEGTNMMKDTTIFVVRKRSTPESVVESSGVLESFESNQSQSRPSQSEPDLTARSDVSESELLQGDMQKFQVMHREHVKFDQNSDLLKGFLSGSTDDWKNVSQGLDQIELEDIKVGFSTDTEIINFHSPQYITGRPTVIVPEDDSNNRIETEK